jgi:hypothetical protein
MYFAGPVPNLAAGAGKIATSGSKKADFPTVAEPAIMVLLGTTVLCLAIYSKRRKNG